MDPERPGYTLRLILTRWQVVWDTTKFNNKADWPEDGSQPFVLSSGDPYVALVPRALLLF
jgi:hypothetical protein